jgi:hypothetical protein
VTDLRLHSCNVVATPKSPDFFLFSELTTCPWHWFLFYSFQLLPHSLNQSSPCNGSILPYATCCQVAGENHSQADVPALLPLLCMPFFGQPICFHGFTWKIFAAMLQPLPAAQTSVPSSRHTPSQWSYALRYPRLNSPTAFSNLLSSSIIKKTLGFKNKEHEGLGLFLASKSN